MTAKRYKVLYPVDFSNRCVSAAPYVKTWVDRLDAALDTVHIIGHDPLDPEQDDALRSAERRMADLKFFSERYFGKDVASNTVLTGSIPDQIEYFAKREEVDLIMLPRDHQNLAIRFFHDSLTATLLERCPASVWTTEHIDEVPAVPSRILCAVHFDRDVSLEAQNYRMLQIVRELVARFQASVAFLHVEKQNRELGEADTNLEDVVDIESWKMKALEVFGNAVPLLRKSGDVITAISDTAKQLDADLIVTGRTTPGSIGIGPQNRVLKIDHATHRPVLSVW
jgi:nucleotide-binding universal stress UspA family protein